MRHQDRVHLVPLITEIAYRAVSEVGRDFNIRTPAAVALVAEGLAGKIVETILFHDTCNHDGTLSSTQAPDLETYEVLCKIFDEMQKKIPIIARMDVTVELSRLDRKGQGVH